MGFTLERFNEAMKKLAGLVESAKKLSEPLIVDKVKIEGDEYRSSETCPQCRGIINDTTWIVRGKKVMFCIHERMIHPYLAKHDATPYQGFDLKTDTELMINIIKVMLT